MTAEVVIDAPPLTPPPNGLLNAATVVERDDVHWLNGLRFLREPCTDVGDIPFTFDPCATTFGYDDTQLNGGDVLTFMPFGVEGYAKCSTFGYQRADYEARARRALTARESVAAEYELATGTVISDNLNLQGEAVTLNSGTAVDARLAMALLTQAIADARLGTGMIHARPGLVALWSGLNMLRWANGKLYTLGGNLVVPGAGYPGASPDGDEATSSSEWAYASDAVQVHRGPVEVFVPEGDAAGIDRENNTITVRAQRMYAVIGNFCGVYAVNVNPTT